MKMHLNLATADLSASVQFYSTLLGARPVKQLGDYALFVTEQPGLELALDLSAGARAGGGEHFGIVVDTVEAVDAQIARLEQAGYAVDVERDETCCYANQTKVWATDPEGRRWETYVVHEESEARDDADMECCRTEAAAAAGAGCCP
ncbi:MAG TPA: ArsI/CadI family heavy metal resistance metalloenzyme [Candidatus Elarobacter sp.]|jgi:catechol 2,3-dioxygenase-like lactoylglutathione lyase family enzyme|nr:ArsI/CadI family heavy metal resistance metalloenzyme [Candidatus Elarobacter sp.]